MLTHRLLVGQQSLLNFGKGYSCLGIVLRLEGSSDVLFEFVEMSSNDATDLLVRG